MRGIKENITRDNIKAVLFDNEKPYSGEIKQILGSVLLKQSYVTRKKKIEGPEG